jgi:hypothetical protein
MTSARRRIKHREAALMFAPVLVLLVVGWFLRDKRSTYTPLRTSGPLQTVVTDIKLVPLKPMEVAKVSTPKSKLAWHSKVALPRKDLANLASRPGLKNVRLTGLRSKPSHVSKDDEVAVEIGKHRWKLNDNSVVTRSKKLHSVCRWQNGSVRVPSRSQRRPRFRPKFHTQIPRGTTSRGAGPMRPVPFQIVVRAPNQVVTPPQLSRDTKMTIEKVTQEYTRSSGSFNGKTIPVVRVNVVLKRALSWLGNSKPSLQLSRPYIVDEKGRRYSEFKFNGFTWNSIATGGYFFDTNADGTAKDDKVTISFQIPVDSIPLSAGQLTLKAYVSCNDNWPVAISIVVRTKAESLPPKPSPFTLAKVTFGSNQYDRKVTQVEVLLRYKGRKLLTEGEHSKIITDWSPRLVDAKGKEYTEFPTAPNELSGFGSSGVTFDTKTKLRRVVYSFPMKTVPRTAGRLTFRAEIGMRGYKFLPVSVVVRP